MTDDSKSGMNIRDVDKFRETFWDWTSFNECFSPTKIRITDIDGAVERGGYFLFIETKLPGEEIPLGQRLMYDALARLPRCHILIIWGKPNQPEAFQWWGTGLPKTKGSLTTVQSLIRRWFAHVNKQVEPLLVTLTKEAQREFEEIKPPVWNHSTPPLGFQAEPQFKKDAA